MKPTTRFYQLTATEFDWQISDQKTIRAWGFNQTLPGPTIRAKKGDELVIRVKNNLNERTTVHWHGIRLSSTMDGTDDVQKPILPGEEFEYRFIAPDSGTFWYHSHQNETEQMERGMYGALIIEDEDDPIVDVERVMMIDDMKLTPDNQFKRGGFIERWKERHDGRQGDSILINGRENTVINMHAGQTERWRIINSSSARYVRLYLAGKPFQIIGTDGGLVEQPQQATEVLIIPGERMDILVGPFSDGENFLVESLPYNRTTFLKAKREQLATVRIDAERSSVAQVPDRLRTIESLAAQDATATRKIKFSVAPSWKRGIDFLVNNHLHDDDKPVNVGEMQVWEVSNTSLMDHPFHLHGFFFQVIDEDGKVPAYKAWKDSYNLKPKSKIKIAWMPDNRPGKWMYHCHILEHHEAGMMSHFEVVDPAKGASKTTPHHH